MDLITTMHYTFSAIAQTAGAILALGGVFVVFKLERIGKGTTKFHDKAVSMSLKTEEDFISINDYELIKRLESEKERLLSLGWVRDRLGSHTEKIAKERYEKILESLKKNNKAEDDAKEIFRITLVMFGIVIILNLFSLSITRLFTDQSVFYLVVIGSLILMIIGLYSFWKIFDIEYEL